MPVNPRVLIVGGFVAAAVVVVALFRAAPHDPSAVDSSSLGKSFSKAEVVALAEQFVRQNGYTTAPDEELKRRLDFESIEFANSRQELLEQRRGTLQPKAIGIRATELGWGVAFDFAENEDGCRVVTMSNNGGEIRMQHVDGVREYWLGSNGTTTR